MTRPRLVGLSANVQRPSKTRTLVDAVLREAGARAPLDVRLLDFVDAGTGLGAAWTRDQLPASSRSVLAAIEEADGLVVGSPVYKGAYTGLFKHLFDFVHHEALKQVPVLLAATGGSERHALIIDHQLRPLFGFFQALSLPVGVYAAEADFDNYHISNTQLRERIERAVEAAVASLGPRFQRNASAA